MATIHTLPPECIFKIIALGCEDAPEIWIKWWSIIENQRHMHPCIAITLQLSSRWREISYTMLNSQSSALFYFSYISMTGGPHRSFHEPMPDHLNAIAHFRQALLDSSQCRLYITIGTLNTVDTRGAAGLVLREIYMHAMDMIAPYEKQVKRIAISSRSRHLQAHFLCMLNKLKLEQLEEVTFDAWDQEDLRLLTSFHCRSEASQCNAEDHVIFRSSSPAMINVRKLNLSGISGVDIAQLPGRLTSLRMHFDVIVTREQLQNLLRQLYVLRHLSIAASLDADQFVETPPLSFDLDRLDSLYVSGSPASIYIYLASVNPSQISSLEITIPSGQYHVSHLYQLQPDLVVLPVLCDTTAVIDFSQLIPLVSFIRISKISRLTIRNWDRAGHMPLEAEIAPLKFLVCDLITESLDQDQIFLLLFCSQVDISSSLVITSGHPHLTHLTSKVDGKALKRHHNLKTLSFTGCFPEFIVSLLELVDFPLLCDLRITPFNSWSTIDWNNWMHYCLDCLTIFSKIATLTISLPVVSNIELNPLMQFPNVKKLTVIVTRDATNTVLPVQWTAENDGEKLGLLVERHLTWIKPSTCSDMPVPMLKVLTIRFEPSCDLSEELCDLLMPLVDEIVQLRKNVGAPLETVYFEGVHYDQESTGSVSQPMLVSLIIRRVLYTRLTPMM